MKKNLFMKVKGNSSFINLEAYMQRVQDKRASNATANPGTKEIVKGDKVLLSPKAKEILEAKKAFRDCEGIREERVAEIKKQIEVGTYNVEPQKIAKNLIKDTLLDELL